MPENSLFSSPSSLESQDKPALSRRTFVRSATALLAAGATGALAEQSTEAEAVFASPQGASTAARVLRTICSVLSIAFTCDEMKSGGL